MKKIFLIIITIVTIFIIYFFTLDRKIYYLVLGDEVSLGTTDSGKTNLDYTYYLKKYLNEEDLLEKCVNDFTNEGYRINDIINDIKNNKKVSIEGKNHTLKNALIKADLVTISINNSDIIGRFSINNDIKDLYNWVDGLSKEYDEMLRIIREYCKEEIIVVGYYYPYKEKTDIDYINAFTYLNNSFKNISDLYDIKYINLSELFLENSDMIGKRYPTEHGYKVIGEQIITEIKDSK